MTESGAGRGPGVHSAFQWWMQEGDGQTTGGNAVKLDTAWRMVGAWKFADAG
jgi:hypothetical protein